jgi:hypothetical protein|tara:strand:+ start:818 stop:1426 length:609 start_codon:yes stop_codon:yes gene_type:complete
VAVVGPTSRWAVCLGLVVATLGVTLRSQPEPAEIACPSMLGQGLTTGRAFCDVLTGRDPVSGIVVTIPRHRGEATLTFDLSNRHTYSEDQIRAGRAFARYTATVGVLTADGALLARGVVQSEFRSADDLVDRVDGGAGPGGVKAVAPVDLERVVVTVPADVTEVSILGEFLEVIRIDGRDSFQSPGRPIAIVSNVEVEYRPR